jgi:hypothetical protein
MKENLSATKKGTGVNGSTQQLNITSSNEDFIINEGDETVQ